MREILPWANQQPCVCTKDPCPTCLQRPCKCKAKIRLGDGKYRQLAHTTETSFWGSDGKPVTAEDFVKRLFGKLPEFYKTEQELRNIWADPVTRKKLLEKLDEAGYGVEALKSLRDLVADKDSDLFDVLEYISFEVSPITRAQRVLTAESAIYEGLSAEQTEFIQFVLERYVQTGVEVLDRDVLPELLKLKYDALGDAISVFGSSDAITKTFTEFQKHLYTGLSA